jgi:hypothetical protein
VSEISVAISEALVSATPTSVRLVKLVKLVEPVELVNPVKLVKLVKVGKAAGGCDIGVLHPSRVAAHRSSVATRIRPARCAGRDAVAWPRSV